MLRYIVLAQNFQDFDITFLVMLSSFFKITLTWRKFSTGNLFTTSSLGWLITTALCMTPSANY